MPGPGDEKDPTSKSSFDDQPTTPVGRLKHPSGGAPRTDTSLAALEQRYEILGEVGHGGMGVVYKARDRETGAIVALKVLRPEIAADTTVVERFKSELLLARKITHKNVCRTHEFNRAPDGSAYISMEFVEGDSLRQVLKRFGAMGIRNGIRIAQQVCAGLREAHAQGVVHHDLKPENVLIDRAGDVKVMDFGIARSIETPTTTAGVVVGTAAYMPPEQAEGKPADARGDIYSLGLILYEMFTGSPAFRADTCAAMLLMQAKEAPPPPRSIEPYLPAFLARAIQKCLEKNPAKRFQTVQELEAALGEREVLEPQAPRLGLPTHLLYNRRSDLVLLLLGALGLAAFILLEPGNNPELGLRVRMTKEMVLEKARDEVTRSGWKAGPDSKHILTMDGKPYEFLADRLGYDSARKAVTGEFPPYSYEVQFGEPDISRGMNLSTPWWDAQILLDLDGSVRSLQLPLVRWVPKGSGLPQREALELAKRSLQQTLGAETSALEMESSAPIETEGRHGNSFRWMKREPTGIEWHYQADIYDRPTLLKKFFTLPEDYHSPVTHFQFLPLILMIAWTVLAVVLFFARRLYSQVRGRAVVLSAMLALLACMAPAAMGANRTPIPSLIYYLISLPIFVTLLTGWLIIVTPTVAYLANRPWPYLTESLMALIRFQPAPRTTGLAVMRGISCGLLIAGCSAGLLRLGIMAHFSRPDLAEYSIQMDSPVPLMTVLGMTLMGAVLEAYLAATFLSLFRRWTSSIFLLAVLGGVVLGLRGFRFPVNWVPSLLPYAVGAAASLVLLKFDLLTVVAAIFTHELWDSHALIQIFQSVGNWQYWLPFLIWAAILAWAVFAGFRPMWDRAGRRVAAMFE